MIRHRSKIALLRVTPYDCEASDLLEFCDQQEIIDYLKSEPFAEWPCAIISCCGSDRPCYDELLGYLQGLHVEIPLFLYGQGTETNTSFARELGVTDFFSNGTPFNEVIEKVHLHLEMGAPQCSVENPILTRRKGVAKRLFDLLFAGSLLLLLSPLFLLVALAIRLESKGKVFYFQPRVGQGYRIFKFFKFRSMRTDADQMIAQLQQDNPYQQVPISEVKTAPSENDVMLLGDEGLLPEKEYLLQKSLDDEKAFFKVQNDPRITKVGHFIRKTSIDELPQLVNVLLGDMSIVGNRPLPLYEAEKLTSDQWATRFLAPAGITGLWQVTERGKSGVSADSRKRLDIEYALTSNFWTDLWILIKTPLAAIQQENV